MNSPFLSIIVPVYNVELYLKKCIDSILSQTFTDFELLLIDDGSIDRSGEICNNYALIDNRVRVFHRSNKGVSSSRNYGIEHALGEYLTFIDSDDEIYPNTLKDNIDILLCNKEIDVLQFPYLKFDGSGNITKYSTDFPIEYLNEKEIFKDIINKGIVIWAIWGKIFKKNVYKKLYFNEQMTISEDLYALINLIDNIRHFYISNVGCYIYNYRENSAFNSMFTPQKILDISRTDVLILKKTIFYSIDAPWVWENAVMSCLESFAYLGSSEELKSNLIFLSKNKQKLNLKYRKNINVILSYFFSPLIVAYIKRLKFIMFKRKNNVCRKP